MAHKQKPIRSDLGWSTSDRIVVRGKDLPGELIGKINLGDMGFLEVTCRHRRNRPCSTRSW
jgi:citrate synthase